MSGNPPFCFPLYTIVPHLFTKWINHVVHARCLAGLWPSRITLCVCTPMSSQQSSATQSKRLGLLPLCAPRAWHLVRITYVHRFMFFLSGKEWIQWKYWILKLFFNPCSLSPTHPAHWPHSIHAHQPGSSSSSTSPQLHQPPSVFQTPAEAFIHPCFKILFSEECPLSEKSALKISSPEKEIHFQQYLVG